MEPYNKDYSFSNNTFALNAQTVGPVDQDPGGSIENFSGRRGYGRGHRHRRRYPGHSWIRPGQRGLAGYGPYYSDIIAIPQPVYFEKPCGCTLRYDASKKKYVPTGEECTCCGLGKFCREGPMYDDCCRGLKCENSYCQHK